MAHDIETSANRSYFSNTIEDLANLQDVGPDAREGILICRLGGSVLELAQEAFPGLSPKDIYARHYQREPQGSGPHFDIYDSTLDPDFPYLATFNLAGSATLTATRLPDDLHRSYAERYPEPTEEAAQARRSFSEIALAGPNAEHSIGTIAPDVGMVLLQKPNVHIVHSIVPHDPDSPGEFIKLVRPADSDTGKEMIEKGGLMPLDQLIAESLQTNLEQRVLDIPSPRNTSLPSQRRGRKAPKKLYD